MWVVPSRSRPHNIARLITAWRDTGATTPAVLCLDSDDPNLSAYKTLSMPLGCGWRMMVGRRKALSAWYNRVFRRWPELAWYGVFADDVLPETEGWDRTLIEAAGSERMAFGDDGINGPWHATHFVLGGDLVRRQGWLAYPRLRRIYIDTIWNEIADAAGARVYLPDVKITHLHPAARLALVDSIYRKSHKEHDRRAYERWKARRAA